MKISDLARSIRYNKVLSNLVINNYVPHGHEHHALTARLFTHVRKIWQYYVDEVSVIVIIYYTLILDDGHESKLRKLWLQYAYHPKIVLPSFIFTCHWLIHF
jgi:hypothetical protein